MVHRTLAFLAGLLMLVACGGGPSSPKPSTAVTTQVLLSPGDTTLASAGSLALTASVVGPADGSVTWTVDGVSGGSADTGTLDGTGNAVTYTAPAAAGKHVVTATSVSTPTASASTAVTVLAPGQILVTLDPGDTPLASGGSLAFQATVTGTSNPGLVWTVDGITDGDAATGLLDSTTGTTNTYTAPVVAGNHTVTVTSQADASASRSSVVSVQPAGTVVVAVSPASRTLAAGATQALAATVTGSSNGAVTWSLVTTSGATGTLSATTGGTVTYTAPAAAGINQVTATSQADPSKSATSVLTVTAAAAVQVGVAPASATLATGATQTLTASVTGSSNSAVTWSLAATSGATGALSATSGATVTYTAPASAGVNRVTATSQADSSKSATAVMTVSATPVVQIGVSPASKTLAAGAAQTFSATVTGSTNGAVTWSLATTSGATGTLSATTGGTVTYTAPGAAGVNRVTATSQADTSKSATAVVTVSAPAGIRVAVSPSSVSLGAGLTQAFTATVTGASNTAVTWAVDNLQGGSASVGLLSGTGNTVTYTAPSGVGSHTLTATSQADGTTKGTATIAVLSANSVSVRDSPYSAKGDGSTDDTAAIERAIQAVAGSGGTVVIPAGTYMINPTANSPNRGLYLGSNMTLSLDSGAVLQAISQSSDTYCMLDIPLVTNVRVTGGTLLGERNSHTGSGGESGVGILIYGSSNVVLDGVTVKDCWGDGIYITDDSSKSSSNPANSNITLNAVVSDGNRRNGLGIVAGNGITVQNSTFTNTSGTLPQVGIDVEPNSGQIVSGLVVTYCTLSDNASGGIGFGPPVGGSGQVTGSTISHNTVSGNGTLGISVSYCDGNTVDSNTVSGTTATTAGDGTGIRIENYATNTTVTNNTVTYSALDGMWLGQCAGSVVSGNSCTNNVRHGINNASGGGATLSNNVTNGNGINP